MEDEEGSHDVLKNTCPMYVVYFVALLLLSLVTPILSGSSLLGLDHHSKSPTSKSALRAVFRGSGTAG